ncbi:MAG: ABC transporter permease [Anaerolineales bacterium]|nr:ABC transporter permease [Anaerolineales bacterium]
MARPHPTLTITRLTFLEAARRRIALAAFVLGRAFLVLYGIAFYFIVHETGLPGPDDPAGALLRGQVYNFLGLMGLYAVNFLTIAMGALVAADTLAGEIGTGTVQALVTKPIQRAEIVLGKWLGFAGLLAVYLLLMAGGLLGILYTLAGYTLPNVLTGLLLIYLETLIIMSLTLAASSTVSTLATGGVVFGLWGLAFIGGFVEQAGVLLRNDTVVKLGILSSLILPTEAVFRRAAYLMTSPVAQSLGFASGPVFVLSVPSEASVVYGALYLLALVMLAVRQFNRRDL